MPNYRFDLPANAPREKVDDLITDAETFGAYNDTNPWFKMTSFDGWRYQVVIKDLKEEDASYLVLKHKLTLIRTELYYD